MIEAKRRQVAASAGGCADRKVAAVVVQVAHRTVIVVWVVGLIRRRGRRDVQGGCSLRRVKAEGSEHRVLQCIDHRASRMVYTQVRGLKLDSY